MRAIGVHHMTALETEPEQFIDLVADAGGAAVSLFTMQPGGVTFFPMVDASNIKPVRQRLNDTGLRVQSVDVLMLTPTSKVEDFLGALDMGGELGAAGAVALVYDDDQARLTDLLGALCEQARQRSLNIGLEFAPFSPACATIEHAANLAAQVGDPALGVCVDILHLVRSGGTPQQVAALDPARIANVQLCDGSDLAVTADYGAEAAGNRLVPGTGVFPLRDFIAALPAELPVELEVPAPQDRPPAERIAAALAGARQF